MIAEKATAASQLWDTKSREVIFETGLKERRQKLGYTWGGEYYHWPCPHHSKFMPSLPSLTLWSLGIPAPYQVGILLCRHHLAVLVIQRLLLGAFQRCERLEC